MTGAGRLAERCPRVWHAIEAEGPPAARPRGRRDGAPALPADGGRPAAARPARLLRRAPRAMAGHAGQARLLLGRFLLGRFWAAEDRLTRLAAAIVRERRRAEPQAPDPVILRFETAALLAEHGEAALFTTINSGSTAGRGRAQRDENTLRPAAAYKGGPAAEIAIPGRVAPPEEFAA